HMVASAVEGLTPDRVAIVDDAGTLLASGGANDGTAALAAESDERVKGVEDRLRTRLEDLLTNVVGPGRARVQVNAELNLDRSTTTSETFDPNGQVIRSTQNKQLANSSTGTPTDGAVSVSNALPGAAQNASSATTGTTVPNETGSTTEETTNYEISKTATT